MPATNSTSEQPSSSLLPRALYGMIGRGTDRLHPDRGAAIKPRCRLVRLTPDGANICEYTGNIARFSPEETRFLPPSQNDSTEILERR